MSFSFLPMLSYFSRVSILFSFSYLHVVILLLILNFVFIFSCCHTSLDSQFCFQFLPYVVILLLVLNFVLNFLPMLSYFSWFTILFSISSLCCVILLLILNLFTISHLCCHTSLGSQFVFNILSILSYFS